MMLKLTSEAAQVVDAVRVQQGVPDHFSLRVSTESEDGGSTQVRLAFVEEPAPTDEITESEGTRLFVASEAVEPLSAVVIDAEQTSDGTGLVFRASQDI